MLEELRMIKDVRCDIACYGATGIAVYGMSANDICYGIMMFAFV